MLTGGQCCRFTLARTLQSSVLFVGKILVGFRESATQPQDLDFVLQIYLKQKALEFRVLWLLKSFTLKGGARHQFVNLEQLSTLSPALYLRVARIILAQSAVARSIHAMILYFLWPVYYIMLYYIILGYIIYLRGSFKLHLGV